MIESGRVSLLHCDVSCQLNGFGSNGEGKTLHLVVPIQFPSHLTKWQKSSVFAVFFRGDCSKDLIKCTAYGIHLRVRGLAMLGPLLDIGMVGPHCYPNQGAWWDGDGGVWPGGVEEAWSGDEGGVVRWRPGVVGRRGWGRRGVVGRGRRGVVGREPRGVARRGRGGVVWR